MTFFQERSTSKTMYKILVVDDEKNFALDLKEEIIEYRFAGQSLDVTVAHSGSEAINLLGKHEFSLMIIDIVMESPDAGLHVIEFIREKQKESLMQIIVMTAMTKVYDENKIIESYDIHGFMNKPGGLKRKYPLIISALRAYKTLVDIRRLTEEAVIRQQRLDALERASLIDLSSDISTVNEFAELVFKIFSNDTSIKTAALFEDDTLLKQYPENTSTDFDKLYTEYLPGNEAQTIIQDHLFIKLRELPDFVFVAGVDMEARKNAANIISQAVVTRQILINIISDKKRIKPLAEFVELIDNFEYAKAERNEIKVTMPGSKTKKINLSISSLPLFFSEDKVLKVHRSYAINPEKIIKIDRHTSREIWLTVGTEESNKRIKVGITLSKKITSRFEIE